jgi:hypothetical protein
MIAPFITSIMVLLHVSDIIVVAANDTNIPLHHHGGAADHDGDASSRLPRRYVDDGFLAISLSSETEFKSAPSGAHTFGSVKIVNMVSLVYSHQSPINIAVTNHHASSARHALVVEAETRKTVFNRILISFHFRSPNIFLQHASEEIIIHGVETFNSGNKELPQVLGTSFRERKLKISPGATFNLPFTFFPQIPSYHHQEHDGNHEYHTGLGSISKESALDLASILDIDPLDLGRHQLHDVITHIEVDSDRGIYKAQIHSSARKSNFYRLPHTIIFERDGFVHSDSVFVKRQREGYRKASQKEMVAYEYDIYMDNLYRGPVQIAEIYPSNPSYVTMEYWHSKGRSNSTDEGYDRFNNCGFSPMEVSHCNKPTSLEMTGPLSIFPGAKRIYIGTVKINKDLLQNGGKLENVNENSLGYLHFQTEVKNKPWFFSIALEFISDGGASSSLDNESHLQDELYVESNQDPAAAMRQRKSQQKTPYLDNVRVVAPANGWLYDCDVQTASKPMFVSNGPQQDLLKKGHAKVTVPQQSIEQPIDFGLVTNTGDNIPCHVSVTNMHDFPIRIMHQRFSFDPAESKKDNSPFDDTNISELNQLVVDFDASETIQPGEIMHNVGNASVDFSGLMSPGKKIKEYRGFLILRFGPANMTYFEWIASIKKDPDMIQSFVVELPLVARTIRGQIQHDVNQSLFPTDVLARFQRRDSKRCGNAFDRKISVINQFPFPLRLNRLQIAGGNNENESTALSADTCRNHFSVVGFDSGLSNALSGKRWGDITVRYKYDKHIHGELDDMKGLKHCSLVLYSEKAGQFHLPLWIYKGEVITTTEDSITPLECRAKDNDESSLTGYDCLDAIQLSGRVGSILSESLRYISTDKTKVDQVKSYSMGQEGWIEQIKNYYSSVASGINAVDNSIHPVVLSFGIVSAGTIDTHSIFIKNRSPIPIDITATVSAVEGMEVRLGRVAVNIKDYIRLAKGNVDIDENSTNEWLRPYLTEVQGPARDYLQSFTYRDDISLMEDAPRVLQQLFHNTASVRLHRPSSRRRKKFNKNAAQNGALDIHPPRFQQEVFPEHPEDLTLGPMLVTLDDNSAHSILARKCSEDSLTTWTIPPGAVARLEVAIRTPTKAALRNRDFSEIITTGIALKTSIGHVIPIVATYKALSGTLEMSEVAEKDHSNDDKSVWPVPSIMKSGAEKVENGTSSLAVSIRNTFTSDILLKDLESCNKWFRFDGDLPKRVAANESYTTAVRASLSCDKNIPGWYPSFYHCALEWLEQKSAVQGSSCGAFIDEFDVDGSSSNETNADTTLVATDVFRRAVQFMDMHYAMRDPNTSDEQDHVDVKFNLNRAKGAAAEWRALSKVGMNKIRGRVRTRFELFENNTSSSSPTITSTLSSKLLETNLDFPYFSGKINKFEMTGIGEVSMLYVPIKNPSGYPVRMRIVEEGNSPFYIHKKKRKDSWWTGRTYYIPDESMEIFHRSMHNVTVQTPAGAELDMRSPSLDSTTAFSHGCSGRRCGFHFGPGTNHHQYTLERRKISTIGASAINGAHLTGRTYNRDGTPLHVPLNTTNAKMRWFAINDKHVQDCFLPPYGSMEIGPFYFRPYAKGVYSGQLILENSLTGFEALRFQGAGSSGKIGFFDNNERTNNGGDIEQRYGKTALIFNDVDQNGSGFVTKTVLVGNLGDMSVEIINVYLSVSQVSGLRSDGISKSCKVNGFRLIDCVKDGDVDSRNGFILGPTQSKLFRISHQYDCVFRSIYASLVIEYKSSPTSSVVKTTELMLGHEMSDDEIWACDNMKSPVLALHSYRNTSFFSFLFRNLSCLFSFVILFSLTWDMISNGRQRNASSAQFRNTICASPRKTTKSKKTGFKTWSSAYRCLARAEPTSAELVQIGNEQTRQMLLNTYRKEEISLPRCVLANGAFSRERQGSPTDDADEKSSHRQSNNVVMTLNDAIFSKRKIYQRVIPSDAVPILPSGLEWRVVAVLHSENRASRKIPKDDIQTKTLDGKSSDQVQRNDKKEDNGSINRLILSQKKAVAVSKIQHQSKDLLSRVAPESSNGVSKKPNESDKIVESPNMSPSKDFVKVVSVKPKPKARSVLVRKPETTVLVSTDASRNTVLPRRKKTNAATTVVEDGNNSAAEMSVLSQDIRKENIDLDVKVKENSSDGINVDEPISALNDNSCILVDSEDLEVSSRSKIVDEAGAVELETNVQPKREMKTHISTEEVCNERKDDEASIVSEENGSTEGAFPPSVSMLCGAKIAAVKDLGGSSKASPHSVNIKADQSSNMSTNESREKGSNQGNLAADALAGGEFEVQASPATAEMFNNVGAFTTNVKKEKLENGGIATVENEDSVDVQKDKSGNAGNRNERKHTKKSKSKPQAQDPHAQENVFPSKTKSKIVLKSPKRAGKPRSLRKRSDRNLSSKTTASTTSDESSATNNISPTPHSQPVIRPPPGLAPPPGFGRVAAKNEAPLSLDSPVQCNSAEKRLSINESDVGLLAKVLDEKNALSLTPNRGRKVRLMSEREEIETEDLLPELGQDSNVMNFLTFLDETFENSDDDSDTNEDDNRPILGEETNYERLPLYRGLGVGMSNNPWSESAGTPRAFAYGFGVEQNGKKEKNDVESDVIDPTLLTPSSIFGHASGDSDDDKKRAADPFDADAFFLDLLE